MRTDQARVALRARQGLEAVDLGFRMVREWWRPLALTWLVFVLPFGAALVLTLRHHPYWALLLLWWLRPVFDRVPLHVLSRALFGERTSLLDVARALPSLLRSGLGTSLFVLRLSPLRTFVLPVLQLEGLRGGARRERCAALARRDIGSAMGLHVMGAHFNAVLLLGMVLGLELLVPEEVAWNVLELFVPLFGDAAQDQSRALVPSLYLIGISAVEPVLVAGGFALYVNRRVYLEGWDIDLAFRRLARRAEEGRRAPLRVHAAALAALALALAPPANGEEPCEPEDPASAAPCVASVLAEDAFGTTREIEMWLPREGGSGGWSLPGLDWVPSALAFGAELALWTGLAALAVTILVVAARRRHDLRSPETPGPAAAPVLFGLDLDPRSLPDDVVAAARACWARGAPIEALSLLYRGALCHLCERGELAIPESATEFECVRLVSRSTDGETAGLFGDLTDAWVAARYAAAPPPTAGFEALCARFQPVFGAGT